MSRHRYIEEPETIADHVVAAVISALAMLFTIALGPLIASIVYGGGVPIFEVYDGPVHIWGAALIVIALVLGLVLGSRRMAKVWGYFWCTEQPERPWLSVGLWVGFFAIVGIGCLIS